MAVWVAYLPPHMVPITKETCLDSNRSAVVIASYAGLRSILQIWDPLYLTRFLTSITPHVMSLMVIKLWWDSINV
jgi:hypothetical protein